MRKVQRAPLVFICAPYRAPTIFGIGENIAYARGLAADVACLGGMPVCPHLNTAYFDGLRPDQFWLDGYLTLASVCDAAVIGYGVDDSDGCIAEMEAFELHGIPMFRELDAFEAWMTEWQDA